MIKRTLVALSLILFGSVGSAVLLTDTPRVSAVCPDGYILTLKPWYDGLIKATDCTIKDIVDEKSIGSTTGSTNDKITLDAFIFTVILNIVDDLFQVVGYITTGFIMFGGFIMLTANGSPEKVAKGRQTILNAVIGLVIALAAIAIVNMIKNTIK